MNSDTVFAVVVIFLIVVIIALVYFTNRRPANDQGETFPYPSKKPEPVVPEEDRNLTPEEAATHISELLTELDNGESKIDHLFIAGCFDAEDDGVQRVEDDAHAEFFTIYAKYRDGDVLLDYALMDFETRFAAENVIHLLQVSTGLKTQA